MIEIDMKMPSCCDECFAFDDHGDYPYCLISQDQQGYTFNTRENRMPSCPMKDAEPRVLTGDEIIKTTEVTTCYIEVKGERNLYGAYFQKYDDDHTLVATDVENVPEMIATRHARLWSSKPTDEQREAVPWTE